MAALCAAGLCALPGRAVAQGRQATPVAFISIQKIMTEAADAKDAAKSIEALRQTKAQELNAKKQALEAAKLELANSGGFFRASRRQQLQTEVQQKEADLQHATQQAQADMQQLQQKVQTNLRNELGTIVTELAKARGIQYVLNQDTAIVLGPTGADLTAEVLERLNALAAERAAPSDVKKN